MCEQSPVHSSETGGRGDVIEPTRTDRELVYLLSQFMSAPKRALPDYAIENADRAAEAGNDVELHVWERMPQGKLSGVGR